MPSIIYLHDVQTRRKNSILCFKIVENIIKIHQLTQKHPGYNPRIISWLHFWGPKIDIFRPSNRIVGHRPCKGMILPWIIGPQKAQTPQKFRFEASKLSKTCLSYPGWPKNILVTFLESYLDFIFEAPKSTFSYRQSRLMTTDPVRDWYWSTQWGLHEAQTRQKIPFEALKLSKTSLTYPSWPKNILVTILEAYLDFIFEAQKVDISVPPPGTPYRHRDIHLTLQKSNFQVEDSWKSTILMKSSNFRCE